MTWYESFDAAGKELVAIEKPYFNRAWNHFCSHKHTPNSGEYYSAGITEGENGIYIAWNIFEDYGTNAELYSKRLVLFALDRLLGDKKTLKTDLGAQGVVTLMNQNGRLVNHLLYASPVKRGNGIEIIEDIYPVYNVKVSLKSDKTPKKVYLAPQMKEQPYKYEGGRIEYTLEKLDTHQIVVIEF